MSKVVIPPKGPEEPTPATVDDCGVGPLFDDLAADQAWRSVVFGQTAIAKNAWVIIADLVQGRRRVLSRRCGPPRPQFARPGAVWIDHVD